MKKVIRIQGDVRAKTLTVARISNSGGPGAIRVALPGGSSGVGRTSKGAGAFCGGTKRGRWIDGIVIGLSRAGRLRKVQQNQ